MSRQPKPYCTTCRGTGYHWAPYYSHGKPRLELQPCPRCTPIPDMSTRNAVALLLMFAALLGFVAWVTP